MFVWHNIGWQTFSFFVESAEKGKRMKMMRTARVLLSWDWLFALPCFVFIWKSALYLLSLFETYPSSLSVYLSSFCAFYPFFFKLNSCESYSGSYFIWGLKMLKTTLYYNSFMASAAVMLNVTLWSWVCFFVFSKKWIPAWIVQLFKKNI